MAQGIISVEQQAATTTGTSLLLQCHPDVWAQVLLPKIVAQGSASSVALTCSTLRDLCYISVQQLTIKIVPESVHPYTFTTVSNWAISLEAHFPSCTFISVGVGCAFDCEFVIQLKPALARLPNLNSINLTVDAATPRKQRGRGGVASLLGTMRKHLSCLRSLSLTSKQEWKGASNLWSELAQLTRLTELNLQFTEEVLNACTGSDLDTLSKLRQLRSLEISVEHANPVADSNSHLLTYQLIAELTSLTSLSFQDCTPHELGCISGCTNLQSLVCGCPDGSEVEVAPEDWTALAQLTALTSGGLQLWNSIVATVPTECLTVLGQMRHLATFAADVLSVDLVPALAACTKLTEIWGGWCTGVSSEGQEHARTVVTIPSVVGLWDVWGPVPFAAFPNLQTVLQGRPLCSTALCSLSLHCTGLQQLTLDPDDIKQQPFFSVGDPAGLAMVGPWKALGNLQGLSSLSVSVQSDIELVALLSAAGALPMADSLTSLELCITGNSDVTPCGLMQIARLLGLEELSVVFLGYTHSFTADEAFFFLCALWGVTRVCIFPDSDAQLQAFQAAKVKLVQSGLPVPASILIYQP